MARPLSEEKRGALLKAAIQAIALIGHGASTAKIARSAGVGEGTLFVYFSSKDELLKQVYHELKRSLRDAVAQDYPHGETVERRFSHIWKARVSWGVENPSCEKALRNLAVVSALDPERRIESLGECRNVETIFQEGFASGVLRKQPVEFLVATIESLAQMVVEKTLNDPLDGIHLQQLGWISLWSAIRS